MKKQNKYYCTVLNAISTRKTLTICVRLVLTRCRALWEGVWATKCIMAGWETKCDMSGWVNPSAVTPVNEIKTHNGVVGKQNVTDICAHNYNER